MALGSDGRCDKEDRTFVEYFAGIGLVHEALKPLGWDCLLANDNDPQKLTTYAANFPTVRTSVTNVEDLPTSQIPTALLATASFPCIDLSQAGGRRGIHAEHSGVVWAFLERIAILQEEGRAPRFLLLENVPGLLTLHDGTSIDTLLREIAALGYAIDLIQVDARHFVPQARNRVFIIASRDVRIDDGNMPDTHIRRHKVQHVFQRNRDLAWHFFDFPQLPSRGELGLEDLLETLDETDRRWWNPIRMQYFWEHLEHDHKTRLRAMLDSGKTHRLTAVRRGRRRGLREQIFNLRPDGLASCLRTPKGGSSIQFVVEVASSQVRVRRITGLESARLQGVALASMSPDFVLPQSEQSALFAFGDAVCVPAVRWVVENSIEKVLQGQQATHDNHQPELELVGAGL